jgi:hypothetical protein
LSISVPDPGISVPGTSFIFPGPGLGLSVLLEKLGLGLHSMASVELRHAMEHAQQILRRRRSHGLLGDWIRGRKPGRDGDDRSSLDKVEKLFEIPEDEPEPRGHPDDGDVINCKKKNKFFFILLLFPQRKLSLPKD